MKLNRNLLWGAGSLLLLTGCIDDKYDLSDIDTTSEFRVNDLVLPINLDPVVLSDIIKIEEGDELKEINLNGETFYGVQRTGDFSSDGIEVNAFSVDAEPMEDKTTTFQLEAGTRAGRKADANTASNTYFQAGEVREELEYKAPDIDGAVRALDMVYFDDVVFSIEISTANIPDSWDSELTSSNIYFPKGLSVTKVMASNPTSPQRDPDSYIPETGQLLISKPIVFSGNKAVIELTANAVDLSYYPGAFSYDPSAKHGALDLKSLFLIDSGRLEISGPAQDIASVSEITYDVHFSLERLNATSIMGNIEYDLEGTGLYIDPINLENMPSFLDDPETDLVISNPQIYLNLQNPISKYGLGYQSTLDIVAFRPGEENTFTSPLIKVDATPGSHNFLLAPNPGQVNNIPAGFNNPERLTYSNLDYLLAGHGLPDKLDINIIDPMIPEQTTTQPFELGTSIEGMEGNYMFLAPLSLKEDSKIVKTVDGWWSEDLADLNIDYLTVTADATNGLSTGVTVKVYAINRDGKQISSEGFVTLGMNAVDQPIEITLKGFDGKPFNGIDGIKLYVIAGANDNEPLAPDQVITLDNLKAKVTGYYQREL